MSNLRMIELGLSGPIGGGCFAIPGLPFDIGCQVLTIRALKTKSPIDSGAIRLVPAPGRFRRLFGQWGSSDSAQHQRSRV